ncbi:MAG: 50S ribosomal protein L29 [Candidatus Omnitrophica bacterium]|nr:50S ribosomal protein L29 [Candidatus Omnitrophota bacterium]MCF7876911.1 50S ribosomal protein L29 [Candidatus Omnitrophota bacterium]MCF7878025.1 50S ribosomal protein L29 [Candidatus Omnitrophota bacterium]MCF7893197.1 50S ribosomal protein L29 [Candidatus Omnitrophota bacterium]
MADIKKIKSLSEKELKEKLIENRKKLMKLQFKRKSGLEKPHLFKNVKKEIAQISTVINEKRRKSGEKTR